MDDRRLGVVLVVLGLVAIGIVQRSAPIGGPPLYDGVVVVEPYRYLFPPAGQKGSPQSVSATEKLEQGANPLTAIATPEQPPQAQIFATPGTLVLPPGTTSIKLSIAPIVPSILPNDGHIAGNVYHIGVTNQADVPLTALASGKVTVVIRGPPDAIDATIEQLTPVGWQPIATEDAGYAAMFLAVVTSFGDFALVAPGPGPSYPTTASSGAPAASTGSANLSAPPSAGSGAIATPGSPVPSSSPAPVVNGSGSGSPPWFALAGVAIVIGAGLVVWTIRPRPKPRRRQATPTRRRR